MAQTCALASYLERKVEVEPKLELLAPVGLNIVCFRFRATGADQGNLDRINADIVADIHESGISAPSTTTLNGRLAIRAAIINHRTNERDIDALVAAVLRFGVARAA